MVTRRSFIKFTGGAIASAYLVGRPGAVFAGVDAGVLDPRQIPKFVTPLPIPGVMPRAGRLRDGRGRRIDYYEISLRQFRQQVLPRGLPPTTVYGYGPLGSPALHSSPSLTIEATAEVPIRIRWVNELLDGNGDFLPPLLPIDPTLHWCNPGGGLEHRDRRPMLRGREYVRPGDFTDPATQYTTYAGPVPMIPHLHGAVGVGDESDGYTEAWYLPDARNIPEGFATVGTWWDFMAAKHRRLYGGTWRPGENISDYPHLNRAAQLWFHDHALGITRLNVYAGALGLLMLRGGQHGDHLVRDRRTGARAWLPGATAGRLGKRGEEIPLAIYDRSFTTDGSWFYPDARAFFDGFDGPFVPRTEVSPVWNPEFFANTMLVNGRTWPRLTVERRRYRFRILNGCGSRFLIADLGAIRGARSWVIGTEGGFLPRPVSVDTELGGHLLIAPAERYDVIVDFAEVPPGRHVLRNLGPDEPYGGGLPGDDFTTADPQSTGDIMAFDVVPARGPDLTTPPPYLDLPRRDPLPTAVATRRVALLEEMDMGLPGSEHPVTEAKLGSVTGWDAAAGSGMARALEWMDPVTENPAVGSTEVWEIFNTTVDAHPIHVHEVAFEVLDRQDIEVAGQDMPGEPHAVSMVRLAPGSHPTPRGVTETGTKDTVIAYPGQVTRIKATFGRAGQYVWHCHILEHEDNEMMRPLRVGPVQPGQPMPHGHGE